MVCGDLEGVSWIFRGQQRTRQCWELLPRVGRKDWFGEILKERCASQPGQAGIEDSRLPRAYPSVVLPDKSLFEEWCRRSVAYREGFNSGIDTLALAQHHGLATRLLDWGRNPLVGLFFGAEDAETSDGAVYALLEPKPFPLEFSVWEFGPWPVLAYEPPPFDRRILAQAALFTLHSSPHQSIEPKPIGSGLPESIRLLQNLGPEMREIGVDLVEFVIPGARKRDVRASLANLGMTRETLFPGLDGLSEHLNYVHQARAKEGVCWQL